MGQEVDHDLEPLGGDTVGVMAKKGAGINSIADLKGKKISVSTGSTTANIFIQTVAPAAGLKPGDYQLINMRPPDQVAALAAGSVDAITSFEPYLTVAEKEGIGTMLMRFGQIDPNPTCLVLSPTLIEKSPETVQAFMKSWLEGVDFWKNNPSRVAEVLHEQYNAAGYSNVTHEMAESIVKQIKVEPELTPAIADHIKAEAERMKAAKEGDSNLLDNSMIVYGAGLADPNNHIHENLPTMVVGKGGGFTADGAGGGIGTTG